jgi:hypothetical protein
MNGKRVGAAFPGQFLVAPAAHLKLEEYKGRDKQP